MSSQDLPEPPLLDSELRELRMPSIAQGWRQTAKEAARRGTTYPEFLAELVHFEVSDRRDWRMRRRIKEAHFPAVKTLDTFDFDRQPGISRDLVLALAQGDFVTRPENVVLLGEIGSGKTHLACAIGFACCQRDPRVRFTTAAGLTTALVEAKAANCLSRKLDQLARHDLVILDELGYVPFDKSGADLLFAFIAKVYEHRSLMVTTNLPFPRWSEVFQDATAAAAVIDRIVHHSTILQTEGKSYRLQAAEQARDVAACEVDGRAGNEGER
jgi:DNA replication protein DnaC